MSAPAKEEQKPEEVEAAPIKYAVAVEEVVEAKKIEYEHSVPQMVCRMMREENARDAYAQVEEVHFDEEGVLQANDGGAKKKDGGEKDAPGKKE
jgi:hypothetical protein